jgi:hypothetical protein
MSAICPLSGSSRKCLIGIEGSRTQGSPQGFRPSARRGARWRFPAVRRVRPSLNQGPRQVLRHECVVPSVPCLRHNLRPIVASGGPASRPQAPGPRSVDAPEARIRAKMLSKRGKDRSRAFAPAAGRHEMRGRAPLDNNGSAKRRSGLRQSHPTSHFSAVLDQHCPQAVTFSLYECSRVNSRREFRTETGKSSSESDDEDALRCARGSSERRR